MGITVAIVGRPNVGKSTLFNRLAGRRHALVHDRPGVTRDRRAGSGHIADIEFALVDTAGFEEGPSGTLSGRMRAQTERAVAAADLVLFLIDARAGVTPDDTFLARYLRKSGRPVILLANKCEGRAGEAGLIEAHALGLGDPVAISAAHGEGLDALYEALAPYARRADELETVEAEPEPTAAAEESEAVIKVAIVGRPNVGKSTLTNRLLGEERMLTGPEPGITRDAIASAWRHRGQAMVLVDTAGLRRRARIADPVEKLATADSIEAIRMAHVVVLVLDAAAILDKQDLAIAELAIEEGRALVIAVNKWDAVADRQKAQRRLRDRLEAALAQARGVPTVTLSAREGTGIDRLMNAVHAAYAAWNRRVATAALNRWLEEATTRHPPPVAKGGSRIRLRYITQVKARPPTFALFSQRADALPQSYSRYLANSLREAFDLPGVPIRLELRKPANPYAEK